MQPSQSQPSDSPRGLTSAKASSAVRGTPQNVNNTEEDSTWTTVDRNKKAKEQNKKQEKQARRPRKPKKCHILDAPRGKVHYSFSTSEANFSQKFEMASIESSSFDQSA
jgi:hypothetical protein